MNEQNFFHPDNINDGFDVHSCLLHNHIHAKYRNNVKSHYFLSLDTHDVNGFPIITIETKILMESGLNCYEVATLILYYNTIPTK